MKEKYQNIISNLSDRELIYHLYITQFILLVVSIFLGFILFDHFSYLKTMNWKDLNIITVGVSSGLLVVIIDILLMKWLPSSYFDDGGLNERIFRNRNVFHIIIIAALVAFSEELLFRGIIQTKVGLLIASIIFAIIHYRYLFNLYLFSNIVLLSFVIGFIYESTNNLAVTIMMHFVIDFLLGIYLKKRKKIDVEQGGTNP